MSDRKISVYIKEPGRKLRHVNISPSLKNLQKIVGGYIENETKKSLTGRDICCEAQREIDMAYFNTVLRIGQLAMKVLNTNAIGDDEKLRSTYPCANIEVGRDYIELLVWRRYGHSPDRITARLEEGSIEEKVRKMMDVMDEIADERRRNYEVEA